jgi:tetratricopeptide (TPR) repeat protein
MSRRLAGVLVACVACASLPGQNTGGTCEDAPPAPILERDPHQLSPSTCSPVLGYKESAGVISVRTLAHKPSKAALREFVLGSRAWEKYRSDEAIRHLTEAVRLDPAYVEAQVKLGAVYADRGQPAHALALFEIALDQEPNWALIHIDRAAALVDLNRPEEAELAARQALRLQPSSTAASYLLGCAMLMQDKITPETAAYLATAAAKYPKARLYLAKVREYLAASGAGGNSTRATDR